MRINVYAQEITDQCQIVTAQAENTGAIFIGVRFLLDSPDSLKPPAHPDDDSSAVTFWVLSGKTGYVKGDGQPLAALFRKAADMLDGQVEDL